MEYFKKQPPCVFAKHSSFETCLYLQTEQCVPSTVYLHAQYPDACSIQGVRVVTSKGKYFILRTLSFKFVHKIHLLVRKSLRITQFNASRAIGMWRCDRKRADIDRLLLLYQITISEIIGRYWLRCNVCPGATKGHPRNTSSLLW